MSPPEIEEFVHLEVMPSAVVVTPLGEPFEFEVTVRNGGARSLSVPLQASLVGPAGRSVRFWSSSLFVPFGEEVIVPSTVTSSQWFPSAGDFRIVVGIEGHSVESKLSFEVVDPTVVVPTFTDVTDVVGLATPIPAATCGQFVSGAAWADIDLDGDLDLVVTRLGDTVQLFVNDGVGGFVDDGKARGLGFTDANGVSFADYDNDGDPDAYVTRDGRDRLLRNDGAGRFDDVSTEAGLRDDEYRGVSAAWGDFDHDGHLDLYVTNYMRCRGEWNTEEEIISQVEYFPDVLYRNRGDGTFIDATALVENDPADASDGTTIGAGFVAAWVDVDGDADLDLYLANDFVGPSPDHNRMWRNDGNVDGSWRFTDISLESGTALYMNAMGLGLGDIDRDGDTDIAISNIEANKMLRNDGSGHFTEDLESGIDRPSQVAELPSVTWGGGFGDFNNDGWEDLFFAAGNFMDTVDRPVGPQPNELFVSDGSGRRFLDLSASSGAASDADAKGVAFADYDADGDLDIFVVNQGGVPTLYRNDTPTSAHWLEVDLVGSVSNRDGCGAVVSIEAAGSTLRRVLDCGSTSVASGSSTPLHFGLGGAATIDRLEVDWPSGGYQSLADIDVDGRLVIEEPSR